MGDILESLKRLSDLKVNYSVTFECGTGSKDLSASPKDLVEILKDPVNGYANLLGISVQDYLMCHEENFNVECIANTAEGKKCRSIVAGGRAVTIQQWAELHGQYCATHGG